MNKYQRRESKEVKELLRVRYRFGFGSAAYRRVRRGHRATMHIFKQHQAFEQRALARVRHLVTEDPT